MVSLIAESNFSPKSIDGKINPDHIEQVEFTHYAFSINNSDINYNQIGVITNFTPLYARSFPCLSGHQWGHEIGEDSSYVRFSDEDREKKCPHIAWGFSAFILCRIIPENQTWPNNITKLFYDDSTEDFKLAYDKNSLMNEYMRLSSKNFIKSLNTLAYDEFSKSEKESKSFEFLINESIQSWQKTEDVLSNYLTIVVGTNNSKRLYSYVKKLTEDYHNYITSLFSSFNENQKKSVRKPIGFVY